MKPKATRKASKFEPEDFISRMPYNVVTNILERLPVQDAVRTGALSRNWRLNWTNLNQLVLDMDFFEYVYETEDETDCGTIISRLLLQIKAITKFVLCLDTSYSIYDEDISLWILFLSRMEIKDLTLEKTDPTLLKLPTHLFSCLELKHLKLVCCSFDPPTSFHGFPNLLSLELQSVDFESGKIGEFFTQCPVLEILNMGIPYGTRKVKLAEFSKLANLKILSLFLYNLDNPRSSIIFELVGFLPKLQELHLDFVNCKLREGAAKKRVPTTFPCLETLKVSTIDLGNDIMLSCAFEMIRSFSNLQNLEISASKHDIVPTPGPKIDYNTKTLLQLQSVVYTSFKAFEDEVCLIKYILACSPCLKKIIIHLHPGLKSDEQLRFSRKLLKLQRAYPVADIDLC